MSEIYTNENVPLELVEELRSLGHSCLTSYDAGNANQRIPDDEVLSYAANSRRVMLTNNRQDFISLHRSGKEHFGIVVFTRDPDISSLAERIHAALADTLAVERFLVRVDLSGYRFDP